MPEQPVVLYDKITSDKLDSLRSQLDEVLRELDGTKARVAALEEEWRAPDELELRDLRDDEAKREIKAYFEEHHGETLYPDEVAKALRLDVLQVIHLCQELAREQQIAEA
jgi:hypothetical protein